MAWKPDYATADELASYLRIDDDLDDVELAGAVTAASRSIDDKTNRQFGLLDAPAARVYGAQWDRDRGQWFVEIDDLMTTTGLTISTPAGAIVAYELTPVNAAADGKPWTRLYVAAASAVLPAIDSTGIARVTVTARWGWAAVPAPIKAACLLQGARFFTRRNAPFGVAGSPELGSELRILAKLDPDVAVMVKPYKRRRKVG